MFFADERELRKICRTGTFGGFCLVTTHVDREFGGSSEEIASRVKGEVDV